MRKPVAALANAVLIFGCQTVAGSAKAMSLSFSWAGTTPCSSKPPEFKVSAVPAGTKYLDFELIDFDAPNFKHGGGTVAYSGKGMIPAGAFTYVGPCPPSGSHHYRWTVSALDVDRHEIGRATATGIFPPR
jgi:phosphatidylethanolamine-binding protein (PEBP) family uncharacterized protein